MKRVPTQTPSASERERGGQPAAVEDATGRHHGDAAAHGVDDLGDQGQRRHLARVAAGLGALGDDEVTSRLDGAHRVVDLAAHADDQDVAGGKARSPRLGRRAPATKAVAPPSMMIWTCSAMPPGMAVSRSTPKGLSVALRTAAISATIFSLPMVPAPRQPKPPAAETAATNRQ